MCRFGRSPLHEAVRSGNLCKVTELRLNKEMLNAEDAHGFTPIYTAALLNQLEIMHALLEMNPDLRQPDLGGLSPLHIAAEKGYTEAVASLLSHSGSDITQVDSIGRTALDWAVSKGHMDAAQILRATR